MSMLQLYEFTLGTCEI